MHGSDAIAAAYEEGLRLIATGRYFEAHEVLEEAWRASPAAERDFFQGLIHVAVAWYQAGRGNRVGCERQLAKAKRRLTAFAPRHRDLEVADLLGQLDRALVRFPDLPAVSVSRSRGSPGPG